MVVSRGMKVCDLFRRSGQFVFFSVPPSYRRYAGPPELRFFVWNLSSQSQPRLKRVMLIAMEVGYDCHHIRRGWTYLQRSLGPGSSHLDVDSWVTAQSIHEPAKAIDKFVATSFSRNIIRYRLKKIIEEEG